MYQATITRFYTEVPTYGTPVWHRRPWHERTKPPAFHKGFSQGYWVSGLSEDLARLWLKFLRVFMPCQNWCYNLAWWIWVWSRSLYQSPRPSQQGGTCCCTNRHRRHKGTSDKRTPTCSWNILARGAQSVSLINLTTSVTVHSSGLLSRTSFSSSSCLISYKGKIKRRWKVFIKQTTFCGEPGQGYPPQARKVWHWRWI